MTVVKTDHVAAPRPLRAWQRYATQRGGLDEVHLGLVYGGEDAFVRKGVSVLPWAAL